MCIRDRAPPAKQGKNTNHNKNDNTKIIITSNSRRGGRSGVVIYKIEELFFSSSSSSSSSSFFAASTSQPTNHHQHRTDRWCASEQCWLDWRELTPKDVASAPISVFYWFSSILIMKTDMIVKKSRSFTRSGAVWRQNARVNATFSRSYLFSQSKSNKINKKRIFAAEVEPG